LPVIYVLLLLFINPGTTGIGERSEFFRNLPIYDNQVAAACALNIMESGTKEQLSPETKSIGAPCAS
jgi:hypothetical protein